MDSVTGRTETEVLRDYLNSRFNKIARGVVRDLQRIRHTFSGPDTGLENAWDEICVQRQGEDSFFWDAYNDTVRHCIVRRLGKLPQDLLSLMWFRAVMAGAEDESEYDEDALIDYIASEFVYSLADRYSNKRIERYLHKEW